MKYIIKTTITAEVLVPIEADSEEEALEIAECVIPSMTEEEIGECIDSFYMGTDATDDVTFEIEG